MNQEVGSQFNAYLLHSCYPPKKASSSYAFSTGLGGPGGAGSIAPSVRGLAFNSVNFDPPAPTEAILAAYTLDPLDDNGGHIDTTQFVLGITIMPPQAIRKK